MLNPISRCLLALSCIFSFIVSCTSSASESDWTSTSLLFARHTHVTVPIIAKTVKDEHHDMFVDYEILYEVTFDSVQGTILTERIKRSNLFNPIDGVDPVRLYPPLATLQVKKGIWFKTKTGYSFRKDDSTGVYSADYDVKAQTLSYNQHD